MSEQAHTQESVGVVVTQQTLIRIIELENLIKRHEDELKNLKEDTKNLIVAGAKIEDGVHIAELKTSMVRRPSWKEEAIALADRLKGAGKGEEWAAAVLEKTEAVPSIQLKIR